MERKFGVELEMVGITKAQAIHALQLVGISIANTGYNHTTQSNWKIVPDGSVRGGFEVVSPILFGEAGIEQLRTVCTALDDMGGSVNRSCGLHVHFDAADLQVNHIRSIVTRYAAHESEIDAFMPSSRRANNNTYCQGMATLASQATFQNATTLQSLITAQRGRYFKVNLQSYHRHGTIEFRQHSGTLNAAKACNWVRLLAAFIDESKAHADAPAPVIAPAPVPTSSPLRGVQAELADMLRQGATTIDAICERFTWQPHSARAVVTRLRQAGLDIVFNRNTRMFTLYGQATTAVAPASTSNADSLWDGIAESIRIFYRNRAAVLTVAA